MRSTVVENEIEKEEEEEDCQEWRSKQSPVRFLHTLSTESAVLLLIC